MEKPHIEEFIHQPLRQRGVKVVHSDLKPGEGIDISGDIYAPEIKSALLGVKAKAVLCCNILEHLEDRSSFVQTCAELVQPGGILIVTVPRSYPLHLDPIDTYFRPFPAEVAKLFPGFDVLASEIIGSTTFRQDLAVEGRLLSSFLRDLAKSLTLRGGWLATRARAHRWFWLFRPYEVSAVILRKGGA